jgi:transcriptional regulator GlxA family with amidase domain
MDMKDLTQFSENQESSFLAATIDKLDFCMKQYRPYTRHDFTLHHLSVITNIPEKDIENYFRNSPLSFDHYLGQWRVKLAKSLLDKETSWNLNIKTIGLLSGFSSAKKFIEAFFLFEGISPEEYQSQIHPSKS